MSSEHESNGKYRFFFLWGPNEDYTEEELKQINETLDLLVEKQRKGSAAISDMQSSGSIPGTRRSIR